MKSFVPHLWGLSFIYTRIVLNDDRLCNTASSKNNSDGATYPRANLRCNTSTTCVSSRRDLYELSGPCLNDAHVCCLPMISQLFTVGCNSSRHE
ncbi:hypothetical protein PHMEG_00021658 [Phytophthora megakarya]|uniref:Uncharacterized protein n=1 Tax=Phytophthora megakarya TaxID=4795 RepID=A0A225VLB6_9STRA|nr:hypothetical protein PHMEG_00021658 [Phytophthora megakarya]